MFTKTPIFFYTFCIFMALFLASPTDGSAKTKREYTGKLATSGQFPYAIRLYSKLKDNTITYCTAVIITTTKLLTAGHCCKSEASRFVVAGDPDQTEFVFRANPTKYRVHSVKKVIIHPKFEKTDDKLVYDLCILILRNPLGPEDGTSTIEISYEPLQKQTNCTALGWGTNYGYQIQHKLYYKQALAYKCNLKFGNSSKYWFVCLEPHTVCPGDSGGPLVCHGKLYGIASFFIGHGDESDPRCEEGAIDYYAALSSERVFIEKNSSVTLTPPAFFIFCLLIYLFTQHKVHWY